MKLGDDPSLAAPGAGISPASSGGKIWSVGTLTYTTGGLVILFCWLLAGDFGWAMKDRSVMWVVQLLIKKFEASDMISGLLIGTLPQALAAVLTPIVSYRSDRHRGRWGRRIPYLMIPTPIAAVAMVGLAFSPDLGAFLHGALGGSSPGLNQSILIVFAICWGVFEVATIVSSAVFFALINDVVPQAVLGRFYGMFRALGLIVGMAFNFWIFGKAETYYTPIFIGIGVLYGVGFTAMCYKVKEGAYPPPPPIPPNQAGGLIAATKTYFQECFTRPYFLWVYTMMAFSWMAVLAINLFNLFFAKSVNMSMDTYGKYLAATFLISFFISYLIGLLADKFHPLRVSLVTMALYAGVTLTGGLLIKDAATFGIGLVAYGVLSGSWQTAAASLTMRLFPQARFAQIDSARNMVTSFGIMLVGPVLGRFLDFSGHNYRYAYIASAVLAVLAVLAGLVVHARFMRLGGPQGYVAPQ